MSDETSNVGKEEARSQPLPAPDQTSTLPETIASAQPTPQTKRRLSHWPYWLAAGFIILAAGQVYLYTQQLAHQADKTTLAVLAVEVSDLRTNAARTSPVADLIATQAQLEQKQAVLSAQLAALQNQVVADHTTLAALQVNAQEISTLTARMAQLNTIAAARMALETGQPLGVVPHATPALAVFANTAPPTLLQLKEAFPAAARSAQAASLIAPSESHFWDKVRLRLEGLITISNGSHVIFGPPAAAALSQMRNALANDDLAQAILAAQALPPSAQTAMASWLTPAKQLLAAQQALLNMAQQGA